MGWIWKNHEIGSGRFVSDFVRVYVSKNGFSFFKDPDFAMFSKLLN